MIRWNHSKDRDFIARLLTFTLKLRQPSRQSARTAWGPALELVPKVSQSIWGTEKRMWQSQFETSDWDGIIYHFWYIGIGLHALFPCLSMPQSTLRLLFGVRLKTAAEWSRGPFQLLNGSTFNRISGMFFQFGGCWNMIHLKPCWFMSLRDYSEVGSVLLWMSRAFPDPFSTRSTPPLVDYCGCFGFLFCALISSPIFREYSTNRKITPLFTLYFWGVSFNLVGYVYILIIVNPWLLYSLYPPFHDKLPSIYLIQMWFSRENWWITREYPLFWAAENGVFEVVLAAVQHNGLALEKAMGRGDADITAVGKKYRSRIWCIVLCDVIRYNIIWYDITTGCIYIYVYMYVM